MHLSSTILSLLPLAGCALAECYGDNPRWYNPQPTWESLPSICNAATISGTFTRGQTKTHCMTNGPNMGARFTIKYNGAAETASMSDANCARLLEREVRGCAFSTGGKHTYDDWFFEASQGGPC